MACTSVLHIRNSKLRIFLPVFIFFVSTCPFSDSGKLFAQLNFNTSQNAAQLAQVLAGPGVIVSNATLNCPQGAFGSFSNGGTTNLGIGNGIILTSGGVNWALGPDNSEGAGQDNLAAGDGDLNSLAGAQTYDACALEFDIVPLCDTVSFQYVFGSEEYLEYVGLGYNDAFAFFISGPGYGTPTNIAIVPGTGSTPVSIDNVNDVTNSAYYVDNDLGPTIQYDGFTTVLDATAIVQPCQTYHLKLVIADAGDGILDSGVFLEQNSLQCGFVTDVEATENSIESCGDSGLFTFCRPTPDATPLTINYTIAGTAINGTDYQTIPVSVTIPAGQTCTTLVVIPIQDALNEGDETIRIIYQPGPCPVMDTTIMFINEDATVDPGPDVTFCSGESAVIGPAPQAGWTYSWSPSTGLSNPNIAQPTVTLTNNGSTNIVQTYTLTADMGPCNATGTVAVTVTPGPDANFSATSPVCAGQSVQFNNTSVPFQTCIGLCPGPPPFCICTDNPTSYSWTFGDGGVSSIEDPAYTYNTAGTYTATLTMTDISTGCTSTATQTMVIQGSGSLVLTVSQDVTICAGQSYTITVSGATSYSWTSNPPGFTSTSSTITVTPSSTTTYLVTGTSGCGSGTENVVVTVGSTITAAVSATNISCNGASDGAITITPSGGGGSYTYAWLPNVGSGPTVSSLDAGNYSVTVTDNNGCSAVQSAVITEPSAMALSFTSVQPTCLDSNGSATVSVTGGTPPYTYQWSTGGNLPSVTGIPAGTYTVIIADARSCLISDTVVLLSNSALQVSLVSVTEPSCFGSGDGTATISASGSTPPYTILWNPSGQTSYTATGLSAGNYSVIVSDASGCGSAITVMVNDPPALLVAGNVSDALCSGSIDGLIDLFVSGGAPAYTFLWSNTFSGEDLMGPAGSYSVTVTDAKACTASQSFTINEPGTMVIITGSLPANCGQADGSAGVIVTGGTGSYSYQWVPGGAITDTVNNIQAGSYSVTVTDGNGCTATNAVSVNNIGGPVLGIASLVNVSCNGFSDGSVTISVSGGNGPLTYLWNTTPPQNTLMATGLAAGPYTITVTDSLTCIATQNVTITEPAVIDVTSYGSTTLCIGQSITIGVTVNGGTTPYSYAWDQGLPDADAHIVSPVVPVTYSVTVTDANGCSATPLPVSVLTPSPITVQISGITSICEGSGTVLTATPGGGVSPYTYAWSTGETTSAITAYPMDTTQYDVTVTDNCGSTQGTASITVYVNPILKLSEESAQGCLGETFTLTASGAITFWWSTYDAPNEMIAVGPTLNVSPLATTQYLVHGFDGVCEGTDTVTVTIVPPPGADFTIFPDSTTMMFPDILFTDASTADAVWWRWDFGDGTDTSMLQAIMHSYRDTGTYFITLSIENAAGCTGQITKPLRIDPEFILFMPLAFTPNNDGKNDGLIPVFIGINPAWYRYAVFDRWGDQIFETTDPAVSWNGTANNGSKEVQQDVYVWMIEARDFLQKTHFFIGHVALVK